MKTFDFAPFTQSPSFPQVRGSMPSAELAEYLGWVKEAFYDTSDMPQNLDSLQRELEDYQHDESVSALAIAIQRGDDLGFTEVQFDPETGRELAIDDVFAIIDFLADCNR